MKNEKSNQQKLKKSDPVIQVDNDTKELLHDFVAEAIDSLDKNKPLIERLTEAYNGESVNSIFRVFHTIKGLSGFFGMQNISDFTHTAETLLDIFRKNIKPQSQSNLDLIYASFDFLRLLLSSVDTNFTDSGHEEEMTTLIKKLKEKIKELDPKRASEEEEEEPVKVIEPVVAKTETPINGDDEGSYVDKFLSEALELLTGSKKTYWSLKRILKTMIWFPIHLVIFTVLKVMPDFWV